MTSLVIKAESISKVYQKGATADIFRTLLSRVRDADRSFYALNSVSFELGRGETLGVIGPNGAGKSTLLKILCGVTRQTSGSVMVKGRVAPLIEVGAGFHPELTGRENIFLNGSILGMSRSEIKSKFDSIVDFAELWDFIDSPVKKYSSGMFVRLGFSIAVHVDPDVLLVDEVLAVGDAHFQTKCFRKLTEFREAGKAIMLVTHDMGAVERNCERVLLLDRGRVVTDENTHNAVNKYLAIVSASSSRTYMSRKGTDTAAIPAELEAAEVSPTLQSQEGVEDDRCPTRPGYNKNEFRYGSGEARINDFALLDGEGNKRTHFSSGELVVFKIECRFYKSITKPIFGFFVRTKEGMEIYNTNTLYVGKEVEKIKRNEYVTVEYKQRVNLQQGDYFFAAGIAQSTANGVEAIDRRYDLACITILPVDKTTGIVNFNTKITISKK